MYLDVICCISVGGKIKKNELIAKQILSFIPALYIFDDNIGTGLLNNSKCYLKVKQTIKNKNRQHGQENWQVLILFPPEKEKYYSSVISFMLFLIFSLYF